MNNHKTYFVGKFCTAFHDLIEVRFDNEGTGIATIDGCDTGISKHIFFDIAGRGLELCRVCGSTYELYCDGIWQGCSTLKREVSTPPKRTDLLSDKDTSILSDLATLREESLVLFKNAEPHWVKLIEKRRHGLESTFAKHVAKYLLEEQVYDPRKASPDDQAAWNVAEAMMKNVRPGFLQKVSRESPSTSSSSSAAPDPPDLGSPCLA